MAEICGAGSLAGEPVARPALTPSEPTGPTGLRTPEGKAISSAGTPVNTDSSGSVIIPGEGPAEFEALLADLPEEPSTKL